jgi:hypothetical protein
MSDRASIALAFAVPGERASVASWLTQSGYDPVVVADLARLAEDLQVHPIEALVADMALVPAEDDVWSLVRRLGANRPLLLVGDASRLSGAMQHELRVVARPLAKDTVLLAVGLALGEGRPSRRLPRRTVEPIPGSAHGIAVTVREASAAGVGLELAGQRTAALPPYFKLQIRDFGVHVLVKRAWQAPVSAAITRCGGMVEGDLPGSTKAWAEFAREAPAPVASVARRWVLKPSGQTG